MSFLYLASSHLTKLVLCLVIAGVFGFSANSIALSCLPTCSSTDGKFIALAEGAGFSTFTPSTLNVRLTIPAGSTDFSIGIFDGDAGNVQPGTFGFWDAGTADTLFSYTLKADPDGDNSGPVVLDLLSGDLPTNDWADFTLPVNDLALDENGNYSYVLVLSHLNNDPTINGFKLRSSGNLFINEIFSFIAHWTSGSDIEVIFPNFIFEDGIGPEDLTGTTYDGSISFFFEIPDNSDEILEIDLWDADCDRGNIDGTNFDTDDPNTPNTIPFFVPAESDAQPEGVNAPPNPFDDGATDGLNLLITVPPTISYRVIFPDGQEFVNNNPSGDREWERFTVSTINTDPTRTDYNTDIIPPGRYEVRFDGLDLQNLCAIRPPLPFTLAGEVDDEPENPTEVPTISEWGLIFIAMIMGVIGILTVRRKQQIS